MQASEPRIYDLQTLYRRLTEGLGLPMSPQSWSYKRKKMGVPPFARTTTETKAKWLVASAIAQTNSREKVAEILQHKSQQIAALLAKTPDIKPQWIERIVEPGQLKDAVFDATGMFPSDDWFYDTGKALAAKYDRQSLIYSTRKAYSPNDASLYAQAAYELRKSRHERGKKLNG